MQGSAEMVRKLEEYLVALQDERRKVEAFKRELPLCLQLLDHEIETSKEQLACGRVEKGAESCEARESSMVHGTQAGDADGGPPVRPKWDTLRQVEKETEQAKEQVKGGLSDKPSWMVDSQLWDRPSSGASRRQEKESGVTEEIGLRSGDGDAEQQVTSCSPRLVLSSRQRPAGAFLPFIRDKQVTATRPVSTRSDAAACNGTDLTLSSSPPPGDGELTSGRSASISGLASGLEEVGSADVCVARGPKHGSQLQVTAIHSRANGELEGGAAGSTTTTSSTGGANRKARRCWSPELHRRFVSALQQLGGSQVATPKQIRELMKVDGLTNDEVKSHLQKYRLHTRRPGPSPQQSTPHQAPHLVVLGGIWMPPEYAAAAAAVQQSSSQGIASVPPFCQPALSTPEYYSHLSQSPQMQLGHAPYYEQQQAASQTQSSPQVPKVGLSPGHSNHSYAGDSAGEEGKSDSTSWKGENGNNEDEADEEGEEMDLSRKVGTSG